MILAIDIGNTNIVVGCFDKDDVLFVERVSTDHTKTELEYAISLKNVLEIYNIQPCQVEGGIISSSDMAAIRSATLHSSKYRRAR